MPGQGSHRRLGGFIIKELSCWVGHGQRGDRLTGGVEQNHFLRLLSFGSVSVKEREMV